MRGSVPAARGVPSAGRRVDAARRAVNDWFARHELAWEVLMGGLAVVYVLLGELAENDVLPEVTAPLDLAISCFFVAEYAVRLTAARSRRQYVLEHLPDLVALIPATRGFRVVRLIRLVRLLRTVPLIYTHLGLDLPVVRRLRWHAARVREHLDRRLGLLVGGFIASYILGTAALVTLFEKPWTVESLGDSIYWAVNTALGSGDPSYVASPLGWALSWSLIGMSLTILAIVTGGIVTFVIEVVLKEGRGMGAAGYTGHIVVCGWNAGARELLDELRLEEYDAHTVLVTEADHNPAGSGVYFVNGDPTNPDDLLRAGIRDAATAVIFPSDETDAADMQTLLVVLAVESLAPHVRTVVQINNSRHAEHLRRARADEIVVPSQIAAHLAARSAIYPGLIDLVAGIVSGGEGSELYRIKVPERCVGQTVADFAALLVGHHRATLLALSRGGENQINPPGGMILEREDDALVVAESIELLSPLIVERTVAEANQESGGSG